MNGKETFTGKALKKIRYGNSSSQNPRKRRISRLILVIDAVFILLIIVFFNTKKPEEVYHSSSMKYKNLNIRFSVSVEKQTHDYLFSLTLNSESDKKTKIQFKRSLAKINIFHKKTEIIQKKIGPETLFIRLDPGESRSFITQVSSKKFDTFAREKLNIRKRERKTLFQFDDMSMLLRAVMTLNTDTEISSAIEFKHEVSDE